MVKPAIHQFVDTLAFGDAISNDMFEIQKALISFGYESKIFFQCSNSKMSRYGLSFNNYAGNANNTAIFHASIGGGIFDFVKELPDKKVMIYHNMTPPAYYENYNSHLTALLTQGRIQLEDIREYISLAVGDSDFNTKELVDLGYKNTATLPIFVDFTKYDKSVNKRLFKKLKSDGIVNVLFVGRFAPNKRHDDVIKSFFIYNKYFNSKSRLILIGSHAGMEEYYNRIITLVEKLEIMDKVVFSGHLSLEDMSTYYKSADLFLSMSEHEGFFVPVLECFYLGVPLVAYGGASAVRETMGEGGVILENKKYDLVAETMHRILSDSDFKKLVIGKQYERVKDFYPDKIKAKLEQIIKLVK